MVLLADEGRTNDQIASGWALERRVYPDGADLAGETGSRARPMRHGRETSAIRQDHGKRVLSVLDEKPPRGYAQWKGNWLQEVLGNVSRSQIWRILRRPDICPQRKRSWCISTDAEFGPNAADVVGLDLNPPKNSLVLSVDEKPSIQALQRAQGYLRLPDGKAVKDYSHCYERHASTTRLATLDVTTRLVKTGHYPQRRLREFLHFMNEIVAGHCDREIHVILDNLNTNKPKYFDAH